MTSCDQPRRGDGATPAVSLVPSDRIRPQEPQQFGCFRPLVVVVKVAQLDRNYGNRLDETEIGYISPKLVKLRPKLRLKLGSNLPLPKGEVRKKNDFFGKNSGNIEVIG